MPENSLLLSTTQVGFGLSRCGAISADTTDEEQESDFTLVLPLSGVFRVDMEGTWASATPAKAVLFTRGQVRRIHHPHGGHDRSAFLTMRPTFAEPFLTPSGRFRLDATATTPWLDYRLRCMIAAARAGRIGALEVEEFAVAALDDLMETGSAAAFDNSTASLLVAEEYLSVHFREQCDLTTIARHVGYSAHHLSRTFKKVAGESMSRRRLRLRIAGAVAQIMEGADDLSRVAVETGFYDHAHMANCFRSHLGVTPTEVRTAGSRGGSPALSGVGVMAAADQIPYS